MTTTLHHGDALDVLKTLPGNSVGAICCDPPAGIGFMNKAFDSDRGGRQHWVAWLSAIMAEALRVTKPGGHGFVWALPRTSHWTATALEDAGWEIREIVTHLFGSGFPKSKNLGNGQGTALKPSNEHWILVRKPIDAPNIAANVARHGVGALDIDGCRVDSPGPHGTEGREKFADFGGEGDGFLGGLNGEKSPPNAAGRWPPNTVFTHHPDCTPVGTRRVRGSNDGTSQRSGGQRKSGFGMGMQDTPPTYTDADGLEAVAAWECVESCPIRVLDAQAGDVGGKWGKQGRDTAPKTRDVYGVYGDANRGQSERFIGDTGGPSRFFPCFSWSEEDNPLVDYNVSTPYNNGNETEGQPCGDESAEAASTLAGRKAGSTANNSITGGSGNSTTGQSPTALKSTTLTATRSTTTSPISASSPQPTTTPCTPPSVPRTGRLTGEPSDGAASAASGNLSATTLSVGPEPITAIASPALRSPSANGNGPTPSATVPASASGHGDDTSHPTRNNASTVAQPTSPSGEVAATALHGAPATPGTPATTDSFFPTFAFEADDFAPFLYQSKASRAERRAGLPPDMEANHPTVKPLALCRWLVRLVCPPGETCLDPFAGSGTTLVACVAEGRDCIGIEQSAEYLEIARARVAHAEAGGRDTPTKRQAEGNKIYSKYGDKLRRCPEHNASIPSGVNTYACGCPFKFAKTLQEAQNQPKPDRPRTLPLFPEVAD